MLNTMQKTVCALALVAATSSAFAADSADLKVIGTISPSACTPTLSGGGVVDYGTIQANTLSATEYTVLPQRQVDLAINCDAPAKVAIKAINGRPGTTAGGTEGAGNAMVSPVGLLNVPAPMVTGLGMDGTHKVGGFAVTLTSPMVDGVASNFIAQPVSTGVWANNAVQSFFYNTPIITSFSSAAAPTVPVAFTTMSGKLNVQAYLNMASELDLTKDTPIDGLNTLELVYL